MESLKAYIGKKFLQELGERREKYQIIAEVLATSEEGILKTQIMYGASLSFTQLNDYLDVALKNKLLQIIHENDKEIYKTTKKGHKYLKRFIKIKKLLETVPKKESESKHSPTSDEKPETIYMRNRCIIKK